MIIIENFINGTYEKNTSDEWINCHNPADGFVYAKLPNSGTETINKACEAAAAAFKKWSQKRPQERSNILLKIAQLIEENIEDLAAAESKDNGKPLSLAKKVDIPRAAENFRFFGQAITQFHSESHPQLEEKKINYTVRQALGVVCCISPWNLPLYLLTWKIAPALASGNCVVAKPSEITPYTAYLLANICHKAGLPKGVLNIIHGEGKTTGQILSKHQLIKAISFTGGTTTGAIIAQNTAPYFKKISLEMGGKNPNIIFADCDYENMLQTTLKSSFSNQGQICLCGSRIFIEESIYDQFKRDFVARVSQLKIGPPKSSNTDIGAIVSKTHMNKILGYIKKAKNEGAKLLFGGQKLIIPDHEQGYYLCPTVLEINSNSCVINQEEVFGPVVSLMRFKSEEEVLLLANDSPYGLSASVWTSNLKRAMYFSEKLETGMVWINTWMHRDLRTPFGGIKNSGLGREGGYEALRFFTEAKNICINYQ